MHIRYIGLLVLLVQSVTCFEHAVFSHNPYAVSQPALCDPGSSAHKFFDQAYSFKGAVSCDRELMSRLHVYSTCNLDDPKLIETIIDPEMHEYLYRYRQRDVAYLEAAKATVEKEYWRMRGYSIRACILRTFYPSRCPLLHERLFLLEKILEAGMPPIRYSFGYEPYVPSQYVLPEQNAMQLHELYGVTQTVQSDTAWRNGKTLPDSKTQFTDYLNQMGTLLIDLEEAGLYTTKTALLFTKEFIEGTAGHLIDAGCHPIHYVQNFVHGNIELTRQVGCLFADLAPLVKGPYMSDKQVQVIKDRIKSAHDLYVHLRTTIPEMNRTQWADLTSRLCADFLILKGGNSGWRFARAVPQMVQESAFIESLYGRAESILSQGQEVATAEGMAFKIPAQAAEDTSMLKNMAEKGKDALQQEKKIVKCIANADQLLEQAVELENSFTYIAREGENGIFLEIKHPVLDNIRVGNALKPDLHHAFENLIDNFAKDARKFVLEGGDGFVKELYQIEGSLNGKKGVFEWIVDHIKDKGVTHRYFIENGKMSGHPNIYQ